MSSDRAPQNFVTVDHILFLHENARTFPCLRGSWVLNREESSFRELAQVSLSSPPQKLSLSPRKGRTSEGRGQMKEPPRKSFPKGKASAPASPGGRDCDLETNRGSSPKCSFLGISLHPAPRNPRVFPGRAFGKVLSLEPRDLSSRTRAG